MQVQVFYISVIENKQQTEEMNAFLRGHKVIDIDKQFVNNGINSFWSFCVRYIDGALPAEKQQKVEKTDYRTILTEAQFSIFSKLRHIRKQLAEADAIPAYAVFTDDELSKMAQLNEINSHNIKAIKGIGEKRIEKYAHQIDRLLKENL